MTQESPSPALASDPGPLLSEMPDWVYLLREFYELYRRLPSGGSKPIRAHQRQVRETLSRTISSRAEMRLLPPVTKPVTTHLNRAIANGKSTQLASTIRAVEAIAPALTWQFGYEKLPRGLDRRYGYAELVGPRGPVLSSEVILGLVLFAPACIYPAHAHDAVSESYVCLSGAVSENDHGVYGPGSLIFNPPGTLHRITASDREPSLLAYAWMGPPEKLAGQKMVFSRPRKTG